MKKDLQVIVQTEVEALGYELVECRIAGPGSRPVLEIRIDLPDGRSVQVADCERVSHVVGTRLDGAPGVVSGRYVLEVSSPGLDRPLTSFTDWTRFVGRWVTVKSARFAAVGGHVEVEIVSADLGDRGQVVRVRDAKGTEYELALAEIERARLAVHWNI